MAQLFCFTRVRVTMDVSNKENQSPAHRSSRSTNEEPDYDNLHDSSSDEEIHWREEESEYNLSYPAHC